MVTQAVFGMVAGATDQWMDAVVDEGVEGGVLTLVAGEHETSPEPPGEDVCQSEVAESSMSGVADSNSPSSVQASGTSSGLHQTSFVPISPDVSSPALSPPGRILGVVGIAAPFDGPQVLPAPPLLHPHEALLRRGSGMPISAVGIAAPFEVGALTPDAGEHEAYGDSRATAMHEAVIRFDRGPALESCPTQAVADGAGARDALRPAAGDPEASPGSCDRMLIELPSRRGGVGAVLNGGALTPAAEEPVAGAHSLRVCDVVSRFHSRELEARFLEAAIASEYRARDGILHSLRLVSPGSVGRKQIREGLLAALRLVLDGSRTLGSL